MATLAASSSHVELSGARPASTPAYDWLMALTASCMGLGAYIDGWAHNHALATGGAIETFFTPWHALLYGGYGLVAVTLIASIFFWHARGYAWMGALPHGYRLSLAGVGIFFAGGILDLIWHTLFGIEASTAALLSPTHLTLVVGAVLMYLGPLRSVVARGPERSSWAVNGPVVVSLLWLLSSFTFFSQYASPFASTLASSGRVPPAYYIDLFEALGVAGVALQAAFLAGVILHAVKIARVPFGTFMVLVAGNVLLVTAMRVDMISVKPLVLSAGAILAGIVIDLLYARWRPAANGGWQLKAFAFAAPALVYAVYFLSVVLFGGSYWSVHLLTGCVATAGLAGLLISYLVAPVNESGARL